MSEPASFRFCLAVVRRRLAVVGWAALAASLAGAPAPSYRVVGHYPLPEGACSAVAIDAAARRLYVGQGNLVRVLNADTGAVVGTIAPAPGVQGLELAPGLNRGFTANAGDDTVTEFDLKSGAVVQTVKTGGKSPVAICYDAEARRIFVANRASGDLSVLAADTGLVTDHVPLGGTLRALVSNGYGSLFVTAEDLSVLHVVDTHTLAALGDDPVAPGVGPGGLAIDPAGRRLFVACANGLMPIVDGDAGFVFQVLPIGSGSSAVVFDRSKQANPDGGPPWKARILAASEQGVLAALRMNAFINYSFHDRSAIPAGARGLAFDPKTGRVLVALPHEILVLGL